MKRATLLKTTLSASLLAGTMLAAGCSSSVVGGQPGSTVIETPPTPDRDIVVAYAPPQIVLEDPTPQPELGVVWIEPEYAVFGGRYELLHGHWSRPPQGRARWIASHYELGDRGYVYFGGRWD
jgi:hypothetical protein